MEKEPIQECKEKTKNFEKIVSGHAGGGYKSSSQRQEILQALRGISCLFVILCHTDFTDFGQSGVDIFMVISGYVIMRSTEHRQDHFLKRRFHKIVPLYWTMTVITSFFIMIAPQLFRSYEVSIKYLIKSLLFIPYMHNGINGPIMALGWTLNYEVLFYVVFFVSMKISYKYRGDLTITICIFLILLGRLLKLPMPFSFWCNDILAEFCYGILLYLLMRHHLYLNNRDKNTNKKIMPKRILPVIVVFVLISFYIMEFLLKSGISRGFGTGVVAATLVFTALCLEDHIKMPKILVYIGDISYLLYLTHIYSVRGIETVFVRLQVPVGVRLLAEFVVSLLCAAVLNKIIIYVKKNWCGVQQKY